MTDREWWEMTAAIGVLFVLAVIVVKVVWGIF